MPNKAIKKFNTERLIKKVGQKEYFDLSRVKQTLLMDPSSLCFVCSCCYEQMKYFDYYCERCQRIYAQSPAAFKMVKKITEDFEQGRGGFFSLQWLFGPFSPDYSPIKKKYDIDFYSC